MNILPLFEDFQKPSSKEGFWEWFNGSKVIDDNGQPLTLYHGTNAIIDTFDHRKKGSSTDPGMRGRGFYFSTNIRSAKSYGSNIYEVHLRILNPFHPLSFDSLESVASFLEVDVSILKERGRGTAHHSVSVYTPFAGVFSGAVREKGFDGIIHGQEYVVFKSDQIFIK